MDVYMHVCECYISGRQSKTKELKEGRRKGLQHIYWLLLQENCASPVQQVPVNAQGCVSRLTVSPTHLDPLSSFLHGSGWLTTARSLSCRAFDIFLPPWALAFLYIYVHMDNFPESKTMCAHNLKWKWSLVSKANQNFLTSLDHICRFLFPSKLRCSVHSSWRRTEEVGHLYSCSYWL